MHEAMEGKAALGKRNEGYEGEKRSNAGTTGCSQHSQCRAIA